MSNFDLANIALKSVCPSNEILYDDKGMPSVMVYIPKLTYAQLGLGTSSAVHPAFIVNGQEVDGVYISKYQNTFQNGRAYSLPCQDPITNMGFDARLDACVSKGRGWHLMTRAEWALLALWCKQNGTMPNGNNGSGKDSSESSYAAIQTAVDSTTGITTRVATGTGPLSWSHDGSPSGIWDLNGNVMEWVGGARLVYGELQIMANNNAADSGKSQAASSAQWMAINASTGALITPNGSGTTSGSVKLDWVTDHWQYDTSITTQDDATHACAFENVTCSASIGDAAKLLLQALCLFKYDATAGAYKEDYISYNNGAGEHMLVCGGYWGAANTAGVFCINSVVRDYQRPSIGFRAAYVALPTA